MRQRTQLIHAVIRAVLQARDSRHSRKPWTAGLAGQGPAGIKSPQGTKSYTGAKGSEGALGPPGPPGNMIANWKQCIFSNLKNEIPYLLE